jgi:hypothetical protein
VLYPKLSTCLGRFEFKSIRSPTVLRLVLAAVPQVKKLRKKIILPSGYSGGPTIFLRCRLRERKSREISPTEIISLACPSPRFLEPPAGKSCSSFRPWRLRSSDILCCYEFQPTYHKSNWVTLTYVQHPWLVWPSVRVLGKPSLKRGWAGFARNWQDGEECVRKHLKSS